MMPVEEAIIELLRISGPCCLDDVVTYLPNVTWERYSSPLIGCRGTDRCYFANSVTRPIRSHSARSFRNVGPVGWFPAYLRLAPVVILC